MEDCKTEFEAFKSEVLELLKTKKKDRWDKVQIFCTILLTLSAAVITFIYNRNQTENYKNQISIQDSGYRKQGDLGRITNEIAKTKLVFETFDKVLPDTLMKKKIFVGQLLTIGAISQSLADTLIGSEANDYIIRKREQIINDLFGSNEIFAEFALDEISLNWYNDSTLANTLLEKIETYINSNTLSSKAQFDNICYMAARALKIMMRDTLMKFSDRIKKIATYYESKDTIMSAEMQLLVTKIKN